MLATYLDPGTGSLMLQILIGSAMAGLFAIKMFWRQLTGFVAGLFSKSAKKAFNPPKKAFNPPKQASDSPVGEDASEKEPRE